MPRRVGQRHRRARRRRVVDRRRRHRPRDCRCRHVGGRRVGSLGTSPIGHPVERRDLRRPLGPRSISRRCGDLPRRSRNGNRRGTVEMAATSVASQPALVALVHPLARHRVRRAPTPRATTRQPTWRSSGPSWCSPSSVWRRWPRWLAWRRSLRWSARVQWCRSTAPSLPLSSSWLVE